jgi:heme exporter protein C
MGIVACLCAVLAAMASVCFLRTRQFQYDSISVAAIEVGLAMLAGSLGAGAVAEHAVSSRWWGWNPTQSAALACGLLYVGYLILRHAVEEPTQRAVFSAVFSIFAFFDIPIVAYAVVRWCSRHPQPPMALAPSISALGFLLLAAALTVLRMRQEESRREIDSLRRTVHAF